jgi:hypothetical protein
MAYIVNKTDTNILATVPDGQIDQLSSSLTLIGKNYSGFGEYFNENLVHLLENFANNSAPLRAIKGQLWYDTSEQRIKVYTGNEFKSVGSAALTSVQPVGLGAGDFWYNTGTEQLYFYDGTTPLLVSPAYSKTQAKSGFIVETVKDSLGSDQTIVLLYAGGSLIGIFSKSKFRPLNQIIGYPLNTDINIGFNSGKFPGFETNSSYDVKFDTTVSNSEKLDGQPISSFMRTDVSSVSMIGSITSSSNAGYTFGNQNQINFSVNGVGTLIIANREQGRNIDITVNKDNIVFPTAMSIRTSEDIIDFYNGIPTSEARFGGNVLINGNLTVLGETVTLSTSTLTVEDKLIELGKIVTPTDETADGGGIILKGATDKIIVWATTAKAPTDQLPALSSQAWNLSGDINLTSPTASIRINGVKIIDSTSLGGTVTTASGLTNFGAFDSFTVDDLFLNDNEISTRFTNTDLILNPSGTGAVRVSSTEIKDVKYVYNSFTGLVESPSQPNDAAPKAYVDYAVSKAPLAFAMDISDASNPGNPITDAAISGYLAQLFPPSEHQENTVLRVLCSYLTNTTETITFTTSQIIPSYETYVTSVSPTTFGTALQNIAFAPVTLPTSDIVITRVVKTFILQSLSWVIQP